MIVRATFAIAAVWLLMPHHPDLGLSDTAACGTEVCNRADSDDTREAVLARLRGVGEEIRVYRHTASGAERGGGAQNAAAPRHLTRS